MKAYKVSFWRYGEVIETISIPHATSYIKALDAAIEQIVNDVNYYQGISITEEEMQDVIKPR